MKMMTLCLAAFVWKADTFFELVHLKTNNIHLEKVHTSTH